MAKRKKKTKPRVNRVAALAERVRQLEADVAQLRMSRLPTIPQWPNPSPYEPSRLPRFGPGIVYQSRN